jgi:hypothetical protein
MKDIKCPYCNHEQNIDHDDGYGFQENESYNQQCSKCDKYFVFTTSIHFSYEVWKADCLNECEHIYEPTFTFPIEFTEVECKMCGERRNCTTEELEKGFKERKVL